VLQRDLLIAASAHLTLLLTFGSVALVLMWESFSPRRTIPHSPLVRYLNNFLLAAADKAFVSGVLSLVSLNAPTPGLLARFPLPAWLAFLITALCLEIAGYWLHRLSHVVPWLWRVHMVHHSDPELDASTAIRHHPLEGLVDSVALIPVILLLTPDPLILLAWNALTLLVAAFSHGNLSVPLLERVFGRVIVTPGFHCVHHSAELPFTNSNYANNFPWLDDLFGTARRWTSAEQKQRVLGLEYFRKTRDQWLDRLLLEPFLKRD
jgi:sterol desaturase/sphingolipid hydroxylase (fatty acid hydroxylase superfamily)